MVSLLAPQIIFLQETMGPWDVVKGVLESWLPRWSFEAVDVVGRSRRWLSVGFLL